MNFERAESMYKAYQDEEKKKLSAICAKKCGEYVVIADHLTICDESEDNDAPADYYIINANNPDDRIIIRFYEGEDEDPALCLNDDDLSGKIIEAKNLEGTSVSPEIIANFLPTIFVLAEEYVYDSALETEPEMIHPGIPECRYLSNGDPGYPAEPPEFETTCPHCGSVISDELGTYRCEECKRFLTVTEPTYDYGDEY